MDGPSHGKRVRWGVCSVYVKNVNHVEQCKLPHDAVLFAQLKKLHKMVRYFDLGRKNRKINESRHKVLIFGDG